MSITRKNRQTGTRITVGSAVELGLNDGEGWLTICEDHGWITSHPTRALAERHAPDPLGWCEVCIAEHAAAAEPEAGADERFPTEAEYNDECEHGVPLSRPCEACAFDDRVEADLADDDPVGPDGLPNKTCALCGAPIETWLLQTVNGSDLCETCDRAQPAPDDDPVCVCGVARSEHGHGACEGFQSPAAWKAERDWIEGLGEDREFMLELAYGPNW